MKERNLANPLFLIYDIRGVVGLPKLRGIFLLNGGRRLTFIFGLGIWRIKNSLQVSTLNVRDNSIYNVSHKRFGQIFVSKFVINRGLTSFDVNETFLSFLFTVYARRICGPFTDLCIFFLF